MNSWFILAVYSSSFFDPLADDEKLVIYLLFLASPTLPVFSHKFEVEFDRNNESGNDDDEGNDDDDDNEVSRKFDEEL